MRNSKGCGINVAVDLWRSFRFGHACLRTGQSGFGDNGASLRHFEGYLGGRRRISTGHRWRDFGGWTRGGKWSDSGRETGARTGKLGRIPESGIILRNPDLCQGDLPSKCPGSILDPLQLRFVICSQFLHLLFHSSVELGRTLLF